MTNTDPAVRESVRVEQMRMLFEAPFPGMLLATVFACALAWHMRGTLPDATLALWVVVKCVAVLPRLQPESGVRLSSTNTVAVS